MELENVIYRYILNYSYIPKKLSDNKFFSEYNEGCYIPYTTGIERENDPFDKWISKNYPVLNSETFLIYIDFKK